MNSRMAFCLLRPLLIAAGADDEDDQRSQHTHDGVGVGVKQVVLHDELTAEAVEDHLPAGKGEALLVVGAHGAFQIGDGHEVVGQQHSHAHDGCDHGHDGQGLAGLFHAVQLGLNFCLVHGSLLCLLSTAGGSVRCAFAALGGSTVAAGGSVRGTLAAGRCFGCSGNAAVQSKGTGLGISATRGSHLGVIGKPSVMVPFSKRRYRRPERWYTRRPARCTCQWNPPGRPSSLRRSPSRSGATV